MGADASIYGQIRPFTMDDPLSQTAKALQVKGAQRQFQQEDDIAGALTASGGDLRRASQDLATRGRGTAALQLRDKASTAEKADLERKIKIWEQAGAMSMGLDQVYRQALQKSGGDQAAAMAEVQPLWQETRSRAKELGLNLPEQFDPQKNFAGISMAKNHAEYFKTLMPNVHMTDTGGSVTPTNTNPLAGPVGPIPGAQPIPKTATPAAPTELNRLMTERDALSEGDARRAQYDKTISAYKAGHGTDVTVNTGPMTQGKTAGNKVDEDLLGVTRNLMQLDTIANQTRPEFQRFQDKVGFMALKAKDSTTGLTNKEKQDLTEYTTYRRNTFNTLNEYIKSITGAAMSEAEANRIRKSMPDPGDGLFGGDSPTEFKAKLDDALKQTKMAVARLSYIKRNGMSLEDGKGNATVPLERMPTLINERGKEIETQLKATQPGVNDQALQRAVRRQLAVEFGLASD